MKAILFVTNEIFRGRDRDDPRINIIIYAPSGTPFDVPGIRALASTFGDYYPVAITTPSVFSLSLTSSFIVSLSLNLTLSFTPDVYIYIIYILFC